MKLPVMRRRWGLLARCSLRECERQAQYQAHPHTGFYLCGHHMGLIAMGNATAREEAEVAEPELDFLKELDDESDPSARS